MVVYKYVYLAAPSANLKQDEMQGGGGNRVHTVVIGGVGRFQGSLWGCKWHTKPVHDSAPFLLLPLMFFG